MSDSLVAEKLSECGLLCWMFIYNNEHDSKSLVTLEELPEIYESERYMLGCIHNIISYLKHVCDGFHSTVHFFSTIPVVLLT